MKSFDFPFNGCNYLSEWSIMFQHRDWRMWSRGHHHISSSSNDNWSAVTLQPHNITPNRRRRPEKHLIRMQLKINWNEFNSNWKFLNVAQKREEWANTNFNYFYNEMKLNFNLFISFSFCLWAPLNQQLKMLRCKKRREKWQKHIRELNVCCILNANHLHA